MKKIISQISFGTLLLSVLIYVTGRWLVQNPMTDDTGDWFLWSGGISTLILVFTAIGGAPLSFKRGFNIGAISAILFLAPFGIWGLFTTHGQKQFPEMSGMLPFFALALAGILILLLVIFNLLWRRKARGAR